MKRIVILLHLLMLSSNILAKQPQDSVEMVSTEVDMSSEQDSEPSRSDFVEHFLDRKVDRKINQKLFILKGEFLAGATASHATISNDNAAYLLVLNGVSADAEMTSVKPYVSYFIRDNRAVGARFGYTKIDGTLDAATLDLGESNGIEFDVPYVSLQSENYSYSVFYRAYAGLDPAGHFGLFAEVELSTSRGAYTFGFENGGEITTTRSESQSYGLSFNPGLSVFLLHNVSASVSFQFGGLDYTSIKQYDANGEFTGSRESSKMRFKINVFAINFGVNIHIW